MFSGFFVKPQHGLVWPVFLRSRYFLVFLGTGSTLELKIDFLLNRTMYRTCITCVNLVRAYIQIFDNSSKVFSY